MHSAAEEVVRRCHALARFSMEQGATTRTYLCPAMRDVHQSLREWLEPAGCTVSIDAAGNLRALRSGTNGAAPRLLIGSHLDTVPNAGAFDGILGVVIGVALLEQFANAPLPFGIELIGFSEEEGVRFGVPFIGSRAVAGTLDSSLIERISMAISDFGLDPAGLPEARIDSPVAGYLEFHIEQGPVLEHLDLPLAVVDAIAGQSRFLMHFEGQTNHAGTSPMDLRADALAGAAEWICAVEREALAVSGAVATVGRIIVEPGESNVIAGLVKTTLDVRHPRDEQRHGLVERILTRAREITKARRLQVRWDQRLDQRACPMDPELTAALSDAVQRSGVPVHRMISGAGHDAMIMADRWPCTMLFLRTPRALSHHPDETVRTEDVATALAAGSEFLQHLTKLYA